MGALRDVLDLRVQTYGKHDHDRVPDPIVEPLWSGLRVLAAIETGPGGPEVRFVDDGTAVDEHPVVQAALARAVRADDAVIDGFLVKAARYDPRAIDQMAPLAPSKTDVLTQNVIGKRRNPRREAEERAASMRDSLTFTPDDIVTFVAIDLLRLDGDALLDVPLLERKRLLESVLTEPDGVRIGAYVRPPLLAWVGSWRAQGFSGLVFKAANGRYHPGGVKDDWVAVPMPSR